MRVLCVAEKPSIAKALAGALGNYTTRDGRNKYCKNYHVDFNFRLWGPCEVVVTSVTGHLTEIEFANNGIWEENSKPLFSAPVVRRVAKSSEGIAKNIEEQARGKDKLFIWTDCDREGEFIGSDVAASARKTNPRIEVFRAIFNNVERSHIIQAAQNPQRLDMLQAAAVDVRRELDLRTGAAFTRFQTSLYRPLLSARQSGPKGGKGTVVSYGACQFPTLGFVVDRYFRRKNFVPEPFWSIALTVLHNGPDGEQKTDFLWDRAKLFDRASAVVLYERAIQEGKNQAKVARVTEKPTTQYKPLPLTTVTLQKMGTKHLKLSSKRIMQIAEELYNKGYISYPRTETDQFDDAMDLRKLVSLQIGQRDWGNYAQELASGKFKQPRKGKHNDKAHPPIHPVKKAERGAGDLSSPQHYSVYEFVTRHFLACCSDDAKGKQTTVNLEYGPEKFHTSGVQVIERNYLDVYPYMKWASHIIPPFESGQLVEVAKCWLNESKTSAPQLLTEPELISLMDTNGIGTDATMADHIQRIQDREFVKLDTKKRFVPLQLGISLVVGYDRIGLEKSLTKPTLRRETEQVMAKIVDGSLAKDVALKRMVDEYERMFVSSFEGKRVLYNAATQHLSEPIDV